MSSPQTIRDHLDKINAALVTGEYGRIDQHVKAIRELLADDTGAATMYACCGADAPGPHHDGCDWSS